MDNTTVGINDFVRRQIKGSGKTHSTLSYQEIAEYAESAGIAESADIWGGGVGGR